MNHKKALEMLVEIREFLNTPKEDEPLYLAVPLFAATAYINQAIEEVKEIIHLGGDDK